MEPTCKQDEGDCHRRQYLCCCHCVLHADEVEVGAVHIEVGTVHIEVRTIHVESQVLSVQVHMP